MRSPSEKPDKQQGTSAARISDGEAKKSGFASAGKKVGVRGRGCLKGAPKNLNKRQYDHGRGNIAGQSSKEGRELKDKKRYLFYQY